MNCKKVKGLLSAYLDSSLKASVQDAVKEHLAKCGKCRDELNTMSKIDNLLKLKIKEKPSKEYWESYWLRLQDRLVHPTTYPADVYMPRFTFAFNGFLIVALILLSSFLYMNTQQLRWLEYVQGEIQRELGISLFHLSANANPIRDNKEFDSLKLRSNDTSELFLNEVNPVGISQETNPVDIINGTCSNLPTLPELAEGQMELQRVKVLNHCFHSVHSNDVCGIIAGGKKKQLNKIGR